MYKTKNKSLLTELRELIRDCGPLPCEVMLRPSLKIPSMWLCRDTGDTCVRRYIGGYALYKIPFSLYFKSLDLTDDDRAFDMAVLENISAILPQTLRHAKSETMLSISAKNGAHISKESDGKSVTYRLELVALCLMPYGGCVRDITYYLRPHSGDKLLKVGTGFTKFDRNVSGRTQSVRYIDEAEYTSYEEAVTEEIVLVCDSLAGDIYDFVSAAPVSSEIDVISFAADGTSVTGRFFLIRRTAEHGELLPQISCTLSPVI